MTDGSAVVLSYQTFTPGRGVRNAKQPALPVAEARTSIATMKSRFDFEMTPPKQDSNHGGVKGRIKEQRDLPDAMTSVSASNETQAHSNGAIMLRKAASILKSKDAGQEETRARSNVGGDAVS